MSRGNFLCVNLCVLRGWSFRTNLPVKTSLTRVFTSLLEKRRVDFVSLFYSKVVNSLYHFVEMIFFNISINQKSSISNLKSSIFLLSFQRQSRASQQTALFGYFSVRDFFYGNSLFCEPGI